MPLVVGWNTLQRKDFAGAGRSGATAIPNIVTLDRHRSGWGNGLVQTERRENAGCRIQNSEFRIQNGG